MVDAILIKHLASRAAPLEPADTALHRERYPKLEVLAVEPPQRDQLLDFDESYPWAEAMRAQERGYQAVLEARQQHPEAVLLYMGFAPIPLALHFGSLFSQTFRIEIFQYQPRRKSWVWPESSLTPELLRPLPTLRRDENPEREVLLRASCSHEIPTAKTRGLSDHPHEVDVEVTKPSPTALRSQADLQAFAYHFRDALDASMTAFPNARVQHLAASVPVGAAFAMGMQISSTKHHPIQTWKFLNRRERAYARSLCIGEYLALPGALLLGASPIDEKPISAPAEVQALGDLLAQHDDRVRVLGRAAAGPRELTELLAQFDPRIVHIACHGRDTDGVLAPTLSLSSPAGYATQIDLEDLLRLLCRGSKIECVVLAACESATIARELSKEVPAVIGFHDKLYDADARDFGLGLWRSLVAGHSVKEAFADACLALHESRRDRPVLCCRPGLDASQLIPIPR